MPDLRIPSATYRLQLNRQFRFADACALVPYLHELGISDLYASPLLKAREGSQHGYDVTDPTRLNPELGTEKDFEALVQQLKKYQMELLLDIVPNHVAASPENPWWLDVLENGLCSPYAGFFDIDWGALDNRILLPILARPCEETLENQELTLNLDGAGLFLQYHGYRLPLDVRSYRLVISCCLEALAKASGLSHPASGKLKQVAESAEQLPPVINLCPEEAAREYRDRQAVKKSFLDIVRTSAETKAGLPVDITLINGGKGVPQSLELMRHLLEEQAYRLAHWKMAREHLNYRHFFDISDLIGVMVEKSPVFEATHSLILRLAREGKVSALRIDHIDGLKDPWQYLCRLQRYIVPESAEGSVPPRFYVVVEKILTSDEALPPEWPVCGTTGYDFAKMVTALFVDSSRAQALDEIYSRFTGARTALADVTYEKKKQVMAELFPGKMRALGQCLTDLAHRDSLTASLSARELTRALTEVTACLPVYRIYVSTPEVSPQDRAYLEYAVEEARRRNPDLDALALDFLKGTLAHDLPRHLSSEKKEVSLDFVSRWQQLTGAVMAKGYEDTTLYCYNRLVSLNDVGSEPDSPGLSVDDFHHWVSARGARWPHTLNATSTHDTKRSEDVRARINVLSEIPEEWENHLKRWRRCNEPKKQLVNGRPVPEPGTEMLLYQTLLGAWPLYENEVPEFQQRLKEYIIKAAREAKVFTRWLSPDSGYEGALIKFLGSILDSSNENGFLADFLPLQKRIAYYGAINSLAQVLLKITSPGIPDFYQGTELWDFSLVDPDNRRPVDFHKRKRYLNQLRQSEISGMPHLLTEMLKSWKDGRVKLYLTRKATRYRSEHTAIFQNGEYLPVPVSRGMREHIFAFCRCYGKEWTLTVAPRLTTRLVPAGEFPLGPVWGQSQLIPPSHAPRSWHNILTGEEIDIHEGKGLAVSEVLRTFPVALLASVQRGV